MYLLHLHPCISHVTSLCQRSSKILHPQTRYLHLHHETYSRKKEYSICIFMLASVPHRDTHFEYRQLRARRALLQFKDVPLRTRRASLQIKDVTLRTRRALSPYTLFSTEDVLFFWGGGGNSGVLIEELLWLSG